MRKLIILTLSALMALLTCGIVTAKVAEKSSVHFRAELIEHAETYMGVPYKWSGSDTSGVDCSGLIYAIYKEKSLSIPRSVNEQFKSGKIVTVEEIQKGDLLFFKLDDKSTAAADHAGIYIGDGMFMHASTGRSKVVTADINSKYYAERFIGVRDYIDAVKAHNTGKK